MELEILHFFSDLHGTFFDKIVLFITHLGDKGFVWIGMALVFLFIKKYRKAGINMAVAMLISLLVVNMFLKNLIERDRPFITDPTLDNLVFEGSFSFPSGHTATSVTAAMSLFYWHKKEGIAAIVLAVLISLSRIYICVHYPTDVLGGAVSGILISFVVFVVIRSISQKYNERKLL